MLLSARATDEIDDLAQRSNMPSALRQRHGYSDFTDPLGRFLVCIASRPSQSIDELNEPVVHFCLATRRGSLQRFVGTSPADRSRTMSRLLAAINVIRERPPP
jgi:hypothetical protein